MLALFVVLVIVGAFAYRRAWRRFGVVTLATAAVVLFSAGTSFLPRYLLTSLQENYPTAVPGPFGQNNAIVLLGLGTEAPHDDQDAEVATFAYGRVMKALEVYQACAHAGAKCTVVVSGGDAQSHGVTEARVYATRLQQLGVPAGDIMEETGSHNTWQNAQFTAPILSKLGADRTYLVTSGAHLRRSLLYFGHFGVDAQPVRADYLAPLGSVLPLSYNVMLTDLALHEYIGLLRYRVYNVLKLNPPAVSAKGSG